MAVIPEAGPLPEIAAGGLPTSQSGDLYKWQNNAYTVVPAATDNILEKKLLLLDENDDTSATVGLYGCVMSNYLALPAQKITGTTVGATGTETVLTVNEFTGSESSATAVSRSFYGVKKTMNGSVPVHATTPSLTNDLPGDESAGLAAFAAFSLDATECCVPGQDLVGTKNCLTFSNLAGDGGGNIVPTNAQIAQRYSVFTTIVNAGDLADWGGSNAVDNALYDADFVLGAMNQLSDDSGTDVNWCTTSFLQPLTATAQDLSAEAGLSYKSKCTWQIYWDSSSVASNDQKYPSIAVKSTTTTSDFFLQWIEVLGTPQDAVDNTKATVDYIRLPAEHKYIGNYPVAEGVFFNPFVSAFFGCWQDATLCGDLQTNANANPTPGTAQGTEAWTETGTDGQMPAKYLTNKVQAGTPGYATLYAPNGADGFFLAQDSMLGSGIQATLNALDIVVEEYDTAVTAYNAAVTTYNASVTAFNAAVADGSELPTVGTAPMNAPSKLFEAALNFDVQDLSAGNTFLTTGERTTYLETTLTDKNTNVVFYDAQLSGDGTNLAANVDMDARRVGYILTNPDVDALASLATSAPPSGLSAAKVFGRLGQGKQSHPDTALGWRIKPDATPAAGNTMQVSIFPDNGTAFLPVTAAGVASEVRIDLEAKIVESSGSSFMVPTDQGVVLLEQLTKTGAKMLASTMAVAAAAFTLY